MSTTSSSSLTQCPRCRGTLTQYRVHFDCTITMCSHTDCAFPFDTDSFDTFLELNPASRKAATRKRKSSRKDTGNGAKCSKSHALSSPLSLTKRVSGSALSTDIEPLLGGNHPTLQTRPGTVNAFPELFSSSTLEKGEGTKQGNAEFSQDSSCVVSSPVVQTSNTLSPLLSCLTLPPNSFEGTATTPCENVIPVTMGNTPATSDPTPVIVGDDISLTINTIPPLDLSSLDIFANSECLFPPEEATKLFSTYQNTFELESSASAPTAVDSASSSINSSGITTAATSPHHFDLSLPLMDLEHLELPTTLDDLFKTSHTSTDPVAQLLAELANPCSTA